MRASHGTEKTSVFLSTAAVDKGLCELPKMLPSVNYSNPRHHGSKKPPSGRQARYCQRSHKRRPQRFCKKYRGAYEFEALLLCAAETGRSQEKARVCGGRFFADTRYHYFRFKGSTAAGGSERTARRDMRSPIPVISEILSKPLQTA